MTAPDRLAQTLIKTLANRGRPHSTFPEGFVTFIRFPFRAREGIVTLLVGLRRAGTLLQMGEYESYILDPRRCFAHGAGPGRNVFAASAIDL
jgi:hypothetical protein